MKIVQKTFNISTQTLQLNPAWMSFVLCKWTRDFVCELSV